jgi:hypothetical protein
MIDSGFCGFALNVASVSAGTHFCRHSLESRPALIYFQLSESCVHHSYRSATEGSTRLARKRGNPAGGDGDSVLAFAVALSIATQFFLAWRRPLELPKLTCRLRCPRQQQIGHVGADD